MTDRPPPADPAVHKVELVISNLLRIGVVTSLLIVVAGTAITFAHHPAFLTTPGALTHLLATNSDFPHTIREVWNGLLVLNGRSLVVLGLLLLIATPVLRVAVSIFAFAIQKDRLFTIITTIVLAILLLSFFLGRVE